MQGHGAAKPGESVMTVETERAGPVAVIAIARPAARNAVDPETAAALLAAFAAALAALFFSFSASSSFLVGSGGSPASARFLFSSAFFLR
jgi:hypothetical protein